jgi:hypothetical protein
VPETKEIVASSDFEFTEIGSPKEPVGMERDGEYRKRKRRKHSGDITPPPFIIQQTSPDKSGSDPQKKESFLARQRDRIVTFLTELTHHQL